jgi:PBP1b-binding outer membrane lipoprotein LpoB
MKKVVLSLAFVAMMFVSCKETEATPEVTEETVETVEATPAETVEEPVEVVADTTTAPAGEVKVEEAAK